MNRRGRAPGQLLAGVAVSLLAAPAMATAATITVTTEDDLLAAAGPCSLREAIQAANTDAVSGGCTAGSGADVIQLPTGAFGLTRAGAGEDANATGDLDVTAGTVTIVGDGAGSTTIDGRGIDRVLDVLAGSTATLQGLTVHGGHAPDGADGADDDNGANGGAGMPGGSSIGGVGGLGQSGGGIRSAGTLALEGVTVSGNRAGRGGDGGDAADGGNGGASAVASGGDGGSSIGGIGGPGGAGGGISATGPLTISNSLVSENSSGAGGDGGAAGNGGTGGASVGGNGNGGNGGISGAAIAGPGGSGGGIVSTGAALTITNSTIAGNSTGDGGDIGRSGNGGNGAFGNGSGDGGSGGLSGVGITLSGGNGGGISHTGAGAVTITGSTIANNATGHGGDVGDIGEGGNGGTGGAGTGDGGAGGLSGAELALGGGPGGGISTNAATITGTTLTGNRTGRGGIGTPPSSGGTGGSNGGGGGSAGSPGASGLGISFPGGDGGNAFVQGTVVLTNVTITNGSTGPGASGQPGGPGPGTSGASIAGSGGRGGGILASADTTMTNVTISNNTTGAGGAAGTAGTGASPIPGIAGVAGTGPGVQAGKLQASIVAFNGATAGCAGVITDLGGNVSFPGAACPGTSADPLLGLLAFNGGPTRTRALAAGSGAIDLVPSASCATSTDQRGVPRPQGAACDAGAYEVAPPLVTTEGTSALQTTKATVTGRVTPNARPTTYHFEFGPTDAYGSSTPDASAGSGLDAVAVEAAIAGLKPGAVTHYRLVATNADGTSAGTDQTLTTPAFGVGIETVTTKLTASRQVPVTLNCPADSLERCAGELVLTAKVKVKKRAGSAKRKTIVVGRAAFEIPAGSRQVVLVTASKKAAKHVAAAKRKGLPAIATATAADAAGNQGVTTAALTLKRAKRR